MRLAKLTLNGFKSFADRTEFHFDDPVTGIVGPNGCGKSNVVDALKWVLGERSSKSLRGKEMLDVIFAGSAARKPAGMASVTLTFENPLLASEPSADAPDSDSAPTVDGLDDDGEDLDEAVDAGSILVDRRSIARGLPVDADIVEVERRLYRDGGSQYLINGKRCRLRDIRDLFLDTGVGADAYSIIEQGRVDAMLLANPQERRTIFEEAAGIARYRQRRVESVRKLDRAERNLAVTREQLANTERRLKIVRGQAAKARRFVELDAELRAWRAARALAQHDALTSAVERIHADMEASRGQREQAEAELRSLEQQRQQADLARHEAGQTLRKAEEELSEANRAVERAEHQRELAEQAANEALNRLDADGQRLATVEQEAETAEAQAERAAERVAAIAEQLADAERVLEQASQARQQAQQTVARHRQAQAEKRRDVERIERDRLAATARVEEEQRRTTQLEEKAEKAQSELASLDEEIAGVGRRRDDARERAERLGRDHESHARDAAELESKAATLGEGRSKQAQAVRGLEERRLRLETRRHAVAEVLESREALGQPVRDVLESAAKGDRFSTVIAPLAELVRVPLEHAAQVEAALGPLLSALVVPSLEAMPSREDLASLSGRVSFVPLGLGVPAVNERRDHAAFSALRASGRLLPLREVTGIDEAACRSAGIDPTSVSGLLDVLLHDCWRTGDLEAAALLATGPLRGATIADHSGNVLRHPGVVSAGPLTSDQGDGGQAMGVLQRRAELEQLDHELVQAGGELEGAQSALRQLDHQASDVADRQTELQRTLNDLAQARLKAEGEAERADDELARLQRQRQRAQDEHESAQTQRSQAGERVAELERKLESLASILSDEQRKLEEIESQAEQAEKDADSLGEALTVARVSASTLGEQIGGARREASGLRDAASRHRATQQDLAAQVQRAREQAQHHQETARRAAQEIELRREAVESLRSGMDAKRTALHKAQEAALGLERRFDAARRQTSDIEKAWHDLELRSREGEIRLENLVQRTRDEDGLDLDAELAGYREALTDTEHGAMRAVGDQEAGEAISTLKSSIDKLGSVNLAAMDEEGQLAEKNEDLAAQVEDIDNARAKLEVLIEQLNEASRHRFGDMLERLQESFAGDNGLFRQLFGGGRAEIRLMPLVREVDGQKVQTDEVDLLESGIEIVARPPGKQPRSISQLSGGEKAMTAVALLLAIFQSKPSCFCVLDEVDAALDDANVDRFSRVVKQFSVKSNFIVITHHKKTMAMCDRLHGVTMQERGVSTRVGVRFDQVGADGRLSAAAVDSSAKAPEAGDQQKPKLRDALAHMKRGKAAEVEPAEPAEATAADEPAGADGADAAEMAEANA
jgi:chromosome segregation protein